MDDEGRSVTGHLPAKIQSQPEQFASVNQLFDGHRQDPDGYVEVNDAYARLLGSTREAVVGRHFSEFMPNRLAEAVAAFENLKVGGRGLSEFPLRAIDGSLVECEWTVHSHFLPGLSLCSARNITQRKHTEEALKASEARFRFLTSLDVDLPSNIAAEARAKIVYERLINFCDDAGTKDALQFLMTREITHMKAFTAALESMGKDRFTIGKIPPRPCGSILQRFHRRTKRRRCRRTRSVERRRGVGVRGGTCFSRV